MIRTALLALPLLALAHPAFAQTDPDAPDMVTTTPAQIATIYCVGNLGNDEAILRAVLTPNLTAAIAAAETENAVIAKAAPEDKPPLGDGIPWQAFPDYAPNCVPGTAMPAADGSVEIGLTYSFPEEPAAAWTDTLILKLDAYRYRVDDVRYEGGGTLRDALAAAFNY